MLRSLALMLALVIAGGAAMALEARVVTQNGVPTLLVDGKPIPPMMIQHLGGNPASVMSCPVTPAWQRFHYTFVAPCDDDNVGAQIRNIKPVGDWFVDDVRVTEGTLEQPQSDNLLKGGDFEGEELPKAWAYFVNSSHGAAVEWALTGDNPHQGSKCLRVHITSPGAIDYEIHLYQRYAIQKGRTYTFSLWLRSEQPRAVELQSVHQGAPWTVYGGEAGGSDRNLKLGGPRGIHLGNPVLPLPWPRDGQAPDYGTVDGMVDHILSVDPGHLLLPRIGLDAPDWWKAAHAGEQQLYDTGRMPMVSPASEVWRRDAEEALRLLIHHLEAKYGEHIVGYHPCAQSAGEWFYDHTWEKIMPCFEEPFRQGFARWAQQRYRTEAALRQAWQQPEVTFATIRVPTLEERTTGARRTQASAGVFRDPVRQRFVMDFVEYMQVCLAEYLQHIAHVVKEETQGKKLTAFFYGYHYDVSGFAYGAQVSGHLRLHQVLHCPDVDILCSPITYGDRESGGPGSFMSPADTIQLHGKLWLNEDDTRTHLAPVTAGYGRTDTMAQTLGVYRRNFGHQLERRCATWWMDFGTGWMADAEIYDNFARECELWRTLPNAGPLRPQVAVITDEDSNFVLRHSNEITAFSVTQMRRRFNTMGCPVGLYLLDDLCEGKLPDSVRMFIFLNTFRLSDAQLAQIRRRAAHPGKLLLWLYAPGYVNGDTSGAGNVSRVVGFSVQALDEPGTAKVKLLPRLPATLTGLPPEQAHGDGRNPAPRFVVPAQPEVTPLGVYDGTQQVGFALGKSGGAWSAFYGGLEASPEVLRALARLAGVHIFCDSNDVISGTRGFVSIHAATAGPKTLHFPQAVVLTDLISGVKLSPASREHTFEMTKGETRLWSYPTR
jgi:beta-galactosidase